MAERELKSRLLKLLKEDEEFRYAVAGLIGIEDLGRGQAELRRAVIKLEDSVARLQDSVARLNDAVARLAEEQRRMWRALRQVTRYIEEVSITLEEEARSMIELRLRQRGFKVKLDSLIRPYVELDIYGSNGELTILGETKTRLAPRHVRDLERKIDLVKKHEPELMRGRLVKAIYAMWAHPEAVKECETREIWLNTPSKELTQPKIIGEPS